MKTIRAAFLQIHHRAIGKSDRVYMSIPPDPERDADLILDDAIRELAHLREVVKAMEASLEAFTRGYEREPDCVCSRCEALPGALSALELARNGLPLR